MHLEYLFQIEDNIPRVTLMFETSAKNPEDWENPIVSENPIFSHAAVNFPGSGLSISSGI